MRFLREPLELLLGALGGWAAAYAAVRFRLDLPAGPADATWRWIGAGAGGLLAALWSASRIERGIDHRVPAHARPAPSWRQGRPLGFLIWKARDAALEYIWLVMAAVVALVILWLARTFL